jgi:hypothetical protein
MKIKTKQLKFTIETILSLSNGSRIGKEHYTDTITKNEYNELVYCLEQSLKEQENIEKRLDLY